MPPSGTPVDNLFKILKGKGYPVSSAAKISQAKTGLALHTGKPPKGKAAKGKAKRKKKAKPKEPF
jgi:hypothetical protein